MPATETLYSSNSKITSSGVGMAQNNWLSKWSFNRKIEKIFRLLLTITPQHSLKIWWFQLGHLAPKSPNSSIMVVAIWELFRESAKRGRSCPFADWKTPWGSWVCWKSRKVIANDSLSYILTEMMRHITVIIDLLWNRTSIHCYKITFLCGN